MNTANCIFFPCNTNVKCGHRVPSYYLLKDKKQKALVQRKMLLQFHKLVGNIKTEQYMHICVKKLHPLCAKHSLKTYSIH
jgi:hypothetical protein